MERNSEKGYVENKSEKMYTFVFFVYIFSLPLIGQSENLIGFMEMNLKKFGQKQFSIHKFTKPNSPNQIHQFTILNLQIT